ncbi:DUF4373 domain-containing protein [Mediterraneibacter massiliensis]|uniref:DUF4373 domain-containing protein n=1 Tax=Mediterraneibacter massiliensis TaxID=1720300 RepID=UPI00073F0998|nr:DUF4373 domain-containing protein [Mediterraneibacter massiliensis]
MARPRKSGLSYFPLDTDFFGDNKIKILKARYGADGIMMYVYLLCEIYKQGYYIQVNRDFEYILSSDLGISADKAKQVLTFLLSRSLFNDKLFQSDAVLTSAGIQKRFQIAVKERARKNPIIVGRYWLLSQEETEPFIKCALFEDLSRKNDSLFRKNSNISGEESLKKSKVNNILYNTGFQSAELEQAFQMYLLVRKGNYGEIPEEQVMALREELLKLSDNDTERIAIAKKATASGWKSFYKPEKKKEAGKSRKAAVKNLNNFERRQYDMDKLERQLMGG